MMLGGGLLPTGGLPEWCVRRLEGCRHIYLGEQQRLRHEAEAAEDSLLEAQEAAAWRKRPEQQQAQPQAWAPPPHRSCPVVLLGAGTPHKQAVVDDAGYVLHESTA